MSLQEQFLVPLLRRWHERRYRSEVQQMLDTPPLQPGPLDFITLSMVQPRDVLPLLAALKSFHRFAPARRVVVVCDPAMRDEHRDTIRQHVPFVEFVAAVDERHADTPSGGCWERLLTISRLTAEHYVVQLDADTLTFQPPQQVLDAVAARRAFVLAGDPDAALIGPARAAAQAKPFAEIAQPHIQALAEHSLPGVRGVAPNYVRGCAGFTGFPPDPSMRERLLHFSREMTRLLGARWADWGSEQVCSNYLVANAAGCQVLAYPAYATPDEPLAGAVLRHYIGSLRFRTAAYRRGTVQLVRELRSR